MFAELASYCDAMAADDRGASTSSEADVDDIIVSCLSLFAPSMTTS